MGRRGEDRPERVERVDSGAWEAVRRALGRLFSRVDVRALGEDRMVPSVRVQSSPALMLSVPVAGAGETQWQPSATISGTSPAPSAAPGAREPDLLPTVWLAAGDYALAPPDCRSLPVLEADLCRVANVDLTWPVALTCLPPAFLTLPPAPILIQNSPLLSAPKGLVLREGRLETPTVGRLRIARSPAPRISRAGDALLGQIALTRRGQEMPPGLTPAQTFGPERQRLAESAGLPQEGITLLGVYPAVPILAVRRLVVEEEGRRLRLWLKPEVLRGKGGERLITLLVGRRTSDGKMLQAAL